MRKTWLITGSSRGFGWELAQAVLDSGDTVLATARRRDQLDELVRKRGDRVRTFALDVTDAAAARAAVQAAVDEFGSPDVVANEVKPLGIKVTIIEPGGFRTDWAGSSMRILSVREEYDQTVGAMNRYRQSTAASWPGDPARAARIIVDIARLDEPPLRLLLGAGAVESAEKASRARAAEAEKWADVSRSADFGADVALVAVPGSGTG